MKEVNFRYFEFGEFRVDTRRRILLKNGETLPLSPRNFELLVVMIEADGQILSHDELLDKVWEGTFVEQANLKNAISVLRKILGEHPNESFYIKTIPRRGYSFVANVKHFADENELLAIHQTHSEVVIEEEIIVDDGSENHNFTPLTQNQLPALLNQKSFFDPLKRHKLAAFAGSLIFLVSLAYGIWTLTKKNSTRFSVENVKISKLTNLGNLNGAIVSPDGNYFLFATNENDGASLWVKQIATGGATRLTPKMNASFWYYSFSGESNYIYYTVNNSPDSAQNGLFKIALFGGSPQKINENISGIIFSPAGNQITFSRSENGVTHVFIANSDFTDEKLITTFGADFRIWSVNWSPDGKGLVFAIRKFAADKTVHYVAEFPTDGGKENIIVPEMGKQITSALWLPDKNSLLVCLREVNAEIRQIWQYFPSNNKFRRVTNDDNSYKGLSVTRDGKTIVTVTENRFASIWKSEDDKNNFKQITSGTSSFDKVDWTSDAKIIYSLGENKAESIFIMNEDGSQNRQITKGDDGIWLFPKVSTDGKSVLFASSKQNRRQLWREDFEGRNLIQLTTTDDISIIDGKFLSNSQTLVFKGDSKDKHGVLFKQTTDGTISPLTEERVDAWDISPDEKFLAYSSTDSQTQKSKVFIKNLESGWLFKILDIQVFRQLLWTPDSKALTFDTIDGDSSEIIRQPIESGEPAIVGKFPAEIIFSFAWSFDGKKLAVIRGKQLTDAVSIKIDEITK